MRSGRGNRGSIPCPGAMKEDTTEFSFILKPAEHGIGVFTLHDIRSGAYLRLFGDQTRELENRTRKLSKENVPEALQQYCMDRGESLICPDDFGHMPVGWYLNHSHTPNAVHSGDYRWYALRDIAAGEEITIDYNTLGEPAESKEYYQK